jgi:hypothetical protein
MGAPFRFNGEMFSGQVSGIAQHLGDRGAGRELIVEKIGVH